MDKVEEGLEESDSEEEEGGRDGKSTRSPHKTAGGEAGEDGKLNEMTPVAKAAMAREELFKKKVGN